MPGFEFSISIEGQKEFSRRLLIVANGISNFQRPLESIGSELLKSFDLNFESRGELFGGWEPRKAERPWPLMENSGDLRTGFRSAADADQVSLTNVTPYFKYHQSNKARKVIPRRVMMKIDAERKAFIIRAFQKYIEELKGLSRV